MARETKSSLLNDRWFGLLLFLFGCIGLAYSYHQFRLQSDEYRTEILKDARIHYLSLMNLKEWSEQYEGVYIPKHPSIQPTFDQNKTLFCEGNVALEHITSYSILRQLSERSSMQGYRFRLSSLHPKNPLNRATPFDERGFSFLGQNPQASSYYEFDEKAKRVYLLESLQNAGKCLRCHSNESIGDLRGGISISYDVTFYYENLSQRRFQAVFISSIFVAMLIAIFFLYRLLYRHDQALIEANEQLEEDMAGNMQLLAEKRLFLQAILDSSPDIMIVTNGEYLMRANRRFFEFFGYDSIEAFKQDHECVCDYFESVDDIHYIQDKKIDGKPWPFYLLDNQEIEHKVKMTVKGQSCIFAINARRLDMPELKILVEFSDITTLENQKRRYEKIATTDKLTGLTNRFHFDLLCHHLIDEAERYSRPLSFIMFDIDHFKNVNDDFGHDRGDIVLQKISEMIRKRLRNSDIFARWGGEEFVILLPDQDLSEASEVAEQLRLSIEKSHFDTVGRITLSFGVTAYHTDDDEKSLFKRADKALYRAKANGRNRVETAL